MLYIYCFNNDNMKVTINEPRLIYHGVLKIYINRMVYLVTDPET